MIMHEFDKWLNSTKEEDDFEEFINEKFQCASWWKIIATLAKEIYELQVCVEGLIEDQEGDENDYR